MMRAVDDPIAQLRLDRLAADLDHRTPMVIHPNQAGARVRAVLTLGIATSAIIGLTWIYTVSAFQVEPATDVGSGNPESSSVRVAGGMNTRLNTLDEEQPSTGTVRLHGTVQKGTAADASCGLEGDVPRLGPWQEDPEATPGLSGVAVFQVSSPGAQCVR